MSTGLAIIDDEQGPSPTEHAIAVLDRKGAKTTPTRLRLFCIAYATHGNGARAMREAGYAAKNANHHASKMLKNPKVAAYIAWLSETLENEKIATLKEVREFWTCYVRGYAPCIRVIDGKSVRGWYVPDDQARLRAAESLAKSLGGMIDNVNLKTQHTEKHVEEKRLVIERRIVHVNASG